MWKILSKLFWKANYAYMLNRIEWDIGYECNKEHPNEERLDQLHKEYEQMKKERDTWG